MPQLGQPSLNVDQLAGVPHLGEVVTLGHSRDDVDNVWKTAAAAAAFAQLVVDFGRHHELPRIFLEEAQDNTLDFLVGDDVAVTDEHGRARGASLAAPKPGQC